MSENHNQIHMPKINTDNSVNFGNINVQIIDTNKSEGKNLKKNGVNYSCFHPLTIENICKTLGAVLKSDLFFMSEQHHSTANSLYE